MIQYQAEQANGARLIGAERLRGYFQKRGRLTGKGVTVGVIDTGMDYTHPDLRRNYAGGLDLVDGDSDPMETKGDVGAATLHGTHVAGIIAANGRVMEIAPDASIRATVPLGLAVRGARNMYLRR